MSSKDAEPTIDSRCEGSVRTIMFNRPRARNAMSAAMVAELMEALDAAENDGTTRVLVFRGAGGHFCAGGDIKDMAAARMQKVDGEDPIARLNASFGHLALRVARSPLPTVAFIEGAVMGGGFGLACTVDVAIAAPSADFRLPETSLGILPAQIAPFLVERLGYSEAKRLALTGARLNAAEARAIGLVHELCKEGEEEATLARVLRSLLRCAPGATAATKKLLGGLFQKLSEKEIDAAAAAFAEAARGPEAAQGMAAFMQKKPPPWAPSE